MDVTHEIDASDDGEIMLWRLNLAEATSDGPLSTLENLARVLIVAEGLGKRFGYAPCLALR